MLPAGVLGFNVNFVYFGHDAVGLGQSNDDFLIVAVALIQNYKTSNDVYEFESLYGIQTEQLRNLKEQGYATKLYFVYGKEWYLYLCNRIAEYPLNLFQALDDIIS